MATKHRKSNDHYVKPAVLAQIKATLRRENMTVSQLAYELRMSRSHVSCMLGGSQPMAHAHMLAIQWVLLQRMRARVKAEQTHGVERLTPTITI